MHVASAWVLRFKGAPAVSVRPSLAQRFIRTLLAGWAYQRPYTSSAQRRAALAGFLTRYNTTRPHRSLNGQTPFERLAESNETAAACI